MYVYIYVYIYMYIHIYIHIISLSVRFRHPIWCLKVAYIEVPFGHDNDIFTKIPKTL